MHNLSCENEFYLHENEKWFPYQGLSTYPRFETEARGNSEMAYLIFCQIKRKCAASFWVAACPFKFGYFTGRCIRGNEELCRFWRVSTLPTLFLFDLQNKWNKINNELQVAHPLSVSLSTDSWSNWNLGMLVFEERGKPEYPEKNLLEQGREPTTNSNHMWRRRLDLNPGHIGGRRVLSPLCHPVLPKVKIHNSIHNSWCH